MTVPGVVLTGNTRVLVTVNKPLQINLRGVFFYEAWAGRLGTGLQIPGTKVVSSTLTRFSINNGALVGTNLALIRLMKWFNSIMRYQLHRITK